MTYRSLLVLLDTRPLCEQRSVVAIELARRFEAHLVGLAPTGLIEVPMSPGLGADFSELARMAWDQLRRQAGEAAGAFRARCSAAGLPSFETVVDEADETASLVRHAHCCDLAIVTQADPGDRTQRDRRALVEQTVMYSARPTLVLPYAGTVSTLGRRALVAWDDSREATRALTDALPLLRHAETVQVVWWNEGGIADERDLQRRLDALRQWLAWQGVAAEVRIEGTQVAVHDAMLSRAADLGTDLIVMGAYGHARWAESMLGGATRGLLESMTVPVLMSH